MDKSKTVEEFNTYCIQFLDFVYDITKNSDITFYKKAIKVVFNGDKSKIIEQFIAYCLKFKDKIDSKDKDYFINTDFSSECNDESLLHVIKLKDLFSKIDHATSDLIFQYLIVLSELAANYLKQFNLIETK